MNILLNAELVSERCLHCPELKLVDLRTSYYIPDAESDAKSYAGMLHHFNCEHYDVCNNILRVNKLLIDLEKKE